MTHKELMGDAYDPVEFWKEKEFGKLQREERSGKYVHKCDLCDLVFWSDEALQLHKIYHAITAQTAVQRELTRDLVSQLEKNRVFGGAAVS